MKTFQRLICVCAVLCLGWQLKAQVFSNEELTVSRLSDDTWVVETSDKTTMYIIEGRDKAMLIDTGTNCSNLDQVERQITQKPLIVVVTIRILKDHSIKTISMI